jgi:hypothetical protein
VGDDVRAVALRYQQQRNPSDRRVPRVQSPALVHAGAEPDQYPLGERHRLALVVGNQVCRASVVVVDDVCDREPLVGAFGQSDVVPDTKQSHQPPG